MASINFYPTFLSLVPAEAWFKESPYLSLSSALVSYYNFSASTLSDKAANSAI